ncbi:MAG: metallophosphoesterase family protein, partial [Promethearchaeota archaeon]
MSEQNEEHKLEFFDLGDLTQFKQIDLEKINEIEENSNSISPIIFEIFEKLMKQCLKGYNFTDDEISFKEYMEFYQEVNRIIPGLEKKIIIEDCNSSVFYIGDTHGAIQESFKIVDFFYKLFQINKETKIIFVGDYVDRNPYDLENLTLITAFHLLFPKNVVLIRGNHEDRLINTHYGFFDNLLRAFREKGEELYEEVIKFFTHLPLVHIAQMHSGENIARVMAVHGGIPIDPLNFLEPAILEEIEPNLKCEVDKS